MQQYKKENLAAKSSAVEILNIKNLDEYMQKRYNSKILTLISTVIKLLAEKKSRNKT